MNDFFLFEAVYCLFQVLFIQSMYNWANSIAMDTDAKSLAYPNDSRIGVRPSAAWKGLLASTFMFDSHEARKCLF